LDFDCEENIESEENEEEENDNEYEKLNEEEKKKINDILDLYKPKKKELKIMDIATKKNMVVYIPCPYFGKTCNSTKDFKSSTWLIKHLEVEHHIKKEISSEIVKKLINVTSEIYNKNFKNLTNVANNITKIIQNEKNDTQVIQNEVANITKIIQ
jgi:hypothetical protein